MDRAFFLLYFMQIFWILLLVTKLEARIHLNNTKLTSSCDKDFISRIDRMHLTVWLDVDQDKTLKDQIDLKITTKAHENLQHICTVTTTDCKTPRCSCVYSAEEQRVFVTVNILLQSEYSKGFIIAKVCSSATDCQNETITQLPIVYDPNSVLLQINSRNVSDNETYIQLSADEELLRFCCLNSPSPCNTKIIQDNKTIARGTPCSTKEITTAAINTTYEFQYGLCNDDFKNRMLQVLKSAKIDDESSIQFVYLVLVCSLLPAILLIFVSKLH
ncbi:uncharacterized protein LOC131957248 [Physella acuta]|uniref:uncharacterized protein LOC131957248 n=1 Tax=Physella acuta TaxID=109671 RepID=UPI0027DB9BBD|nr:uncharacterized protein LOC131957248 [Physella acuta]